MRKEQELDNLGFLIVVLFGMEALTFALWINSPDRNIALLWALPIMAVEVGIVLFALQKWEDKRDIMLKTNERRLKKEHGRNTRRAEYTNR